MKRQTPAAWKTGLANIIFVAFAMLAGLAVLPRPVQAAEYGPLLAAKSSLSFVSRQMGVPSEGHFGKFTAIVAFDPARPEAARARIEVNLASIDAGGAEANEEVKSKGWFNVREFPTASFVASRLKPLGGNRFEAIGKMTIKGRTRDVVAPFTATQEANAIVLVGEIPIQRLQYGIGEGMWSDTSVVADAVGVRFHFTLGVAATPAPGK